MYGNLVNKAHLEQLIKEHRIEFSPHYDSKKAQIAQYPLTIGQILKRENNIKMKMLHSFDITNEDYILEPNQYILINIFERIKLSKDIVGRFIPSSSLIEQGLGLVAGKIEHPFGEKGEVIRFGLKNYLDEKNVLSKDMRVAYVQFFDLHGLKDAIYQLDERDKNVYSSRTYPQDHDGDINYDPE